MGQLNSNEANLTRISPQEVSSRFATKCGQQFTGIELWAFKDVFRRNAKVNDSKYYWTLESFVNFLELPDSVSESSKILYSVVHYLCLFPFIRPRDPPLSFSQTMPTTLTFENMVKVVVLLTGRYKKLLTSDYDFLKLLFCAVAQYEVAMRADSEYREKVAESETETAEAADEQQSSSEEKAKEEAGPEKPSAASSGAEEKVGFWDKKISQFEKFTDNLLKSDKEKEKEATSSAAAGSSASTTSTDDEMLMVDLDKIESWFDLDLIKAYDGIDVDDLRLSPTSLYHIFTLLLAIAPLQPQESVTTYASHFEEPALSNYKKLAAAMTRSFAPKWTLKDANDAEYVRANGISYARFFNVVKSAMPFAFDGLGILFEHFLFNRRIAPDTPKPPSIHEDDEETIHSSSPSRHPYLSSFDRDSLDELDEDEEEERRKATPIHKRPRLPEPTKLMTAATIGQLATFMNVNNFQLYGGLKKLYVGSEAGFSMGSFEQKVFKWNAPTILLIQGYMMDPNGRSARERAFLDQIPPARYASSCSMVKQHNGELVFGAVVNTPWKNSNKTCFGDGSTALFQLEPLQDVFKARPYNENYVYFSKTLGIGFGNLPPKQNTHQNNGLPQYDFGDVSLTLEPSFEYAVFRNVGSETFRRSQIRENVDFEDRLAITEMEVWGVGADDVLREQAKLWEWEENEALRRKNVNLSKDIEESRALLEMAGLVGGGNRSGGSAA
ncbi:TLD-domain-containing protein [Myxozyma melibiosi]|uniref:Restriction of telomere capping protein 5 n=1 Tax=Myxozyma melibiosi TaxID=54550 RepID=A0ABR1F919_9ASCO